MGLSNIARIDISVSESSNNFASSHICILLSVYVFKVLYACRCVSTKPVTTWIFNLITD